MWVLLIGLTLATDELRMCMIYLTIEASLIMIESANNGDVAAWPLSMYRRKKWDPINYLPWTPINNTDCLRMKLGGSLKCSCPFPSHNVQTELKWWCSGHFWLRNAHNQKSVFVVSFVEVCSCVIHEVLFVLENFPLAPPDHSSAYLHWIVHLKDSHWFNSHFFCFLLVETNCSGNPTITVHDWTLPQLSNFHACK